MGSKLRKKIVTHQYYMRYSIPQNPRIRKLFINLFSPILASKIEKLIGKQSSNRQRLQN